MRFKVLMCISKRANQIAKFMKEYKWSLFPHQAENQKPWDLKISLLQPSTVIDHIYLFYLNSDRPILLIILDI